LFIDKVNREKMMNGSFTRVGVCEGPSSDGMINTIVYGDEQSINNNDDQEEPANDDSNDFDFDDFDWDDDDGEDDNNIDDFDWDDGEDDNNNNDEGDEECQDWKEKYPNCAS